MDHGDRREILERLEALERMLRSRHDDRRSREHDREGGGRDRRRDRDDRERGHRDSGGGDEWRGSDRHEHHGDRDRCDDHGRRGDRDRDRRGHDFPEKRIIDLIVRLVSEQVGKVVQNQQAHSRSHTDGGGEKRIVDLIVGLVCEHVQEIVSTELDRRLGPGPESARAERPPSPPADAGAEEPPDSDSV